MASRKTGAAGTRPAGGGKSKNKGTRGGRPEAAAVAAQRPGPRPARSGSGQAKAGNGPAKTGSGPAKTGSGPAKTGNGQARASAARAARARAAEAAAAAEPAATGPPPWLRWTTWALSIAGLGVSIYLTIVHYSTAVSLACPANSTINCEKVITSPQSVVFGIPVAVLGLAFYVFLVAATSPWAWRSSWPPLHWARLGSMVAGIVFVLYLIYAELFTIKAICLWCTSVHVITFFLFVLIVFSAASGYGTARVPSRATAP